MQEKVLSNKKNGMAALIISILVYILAVVGCVFGAIIMEERDGTPILFIISMLILFIGWLPWLGLKVLKPQEALVLTLFGKYYGTIKGDGFYWVNPFCSTVNPAAKTKLNQSGDVNGGQAANGVKISANGEINFNITNNKISLKIMTLNNNRQ